MAGIKRLQTTAGAILTQQQWESSPSILLKSGGYQCCTTMLLESGICRETQATCQDILHCSSKESERTG